MAIFLVSARAPSAFVCIALATCACSSPKNDAAADQKDATVDVGPIRIGSSTEPLSVTADGSNVYWADDVEGTIYSASLEGTNQTAIVTGQSVPSDLLANGGDLFWINAGESSSEPVVVMKRPKDGSAPVSLYSHVGYPAGFAVDAANVYVAMARTDDGTSPASGVVLAIPRAGGNPVSISSAQPVPTGLAIDTANVYWTNGGTDVQGTFSNGTINRAPLGGGSSTSLGTGFTDLLGGLDVGQELYVSFGRSELSAANLIACPLTGCGDGGAAGTSIVSNGSVARFRADGDTLYFTDDIASVMKSVAGAAPVVVAANRPNRPCGISVDASNVYWVEGCRTGDGIPPGTVWRLAK